MHLDDRVAVGAVACLLLALLTWFLVRGISTDAANYSATLRLFDEFALAEASLHRNVLEARSRLLENDNPIDGREAIEAIVHVSRKALSDLNIAVDYVVADAIR